MYYIKCYQWFLFLLLTLDHHSLDRQSYCHVFTKTHVFYMQVFTAFDSVAQLLLTRWSVICCHELISWYFRELINHLNHIFTGRWSVGSFVEGLQCPLGDIRWWSTTFWPSSQWDDSCLLTQQSRGEISSCECHEANSSVRPEELFSLGLLGFQCWYRIRLVSRIFLEIPWLVEISLP